MTLAIVQDDCPPRRMILNGSTWRPEGEAAPVAERRIVRTGPDRAPALPKPAPAKGSWPSFRGPNASGVADGQELPETWDGKTGREHPLADADPGSRAFEPGRLGRSRVRDQRDQQQARARRSSRACTATVTRPTIAHRTSGCSTRSTSGPGRSPGSGSRRRANRATSGTSSPPTPAPRRPPTAASSSRGSARRASTRTT